MLFICNADNFESGGGNIHISVLSIEDCVYIVTLQRLVNMK